MGKCRICNLPVSTFTLGRGDLGQPYVVQSEADRSHPIVWHLPCKPMQWGDPARPPDHWARPSMAHPSIMKPRRTVMKKFALSNLLALTLALGVVASTGLPAQADAPLVTVTGTVVSIVDEVLVVSTDRGNLTFDLDKNTEMPANIAVGNRITVSYDSDDKPEDKMDARKIVMAPASTAVTPV